MTTCFHSCFVKKHNRIYGGVKLRDMEHTQAPKKTNKKTETGKNEIQSMMSVLQPG
ncbi:hypothetical protein JCM10003_754 [Bacteroides pyogenes JCM 10003]|nr:hypothetical protein JCM10003_754 [Bacteroides pyogenes JCM 10003]